MKELIRRYWQIIRRPSVHYSLGFLTLGGFVGGIVFWGAFNTAMEATNTETFCTGCHEMRDNVFVELKQTIHYTNRSGVRAQSNLQASKEVWGTIFGTINTPEKFRDKRLELAQHEWARLKANDSLECRNCHQYESMDFTRQSVRAQSMHSTHLADQSKTCIDCHKGIAHRLPQIPPGTVPSDTPGQNVPRPAGSQASATPASGQRGSN